MARGEDCPGMRSAATRGDDPVTFEQARERLETVGFLLAKYETICKAIKDRRLDRPTLVVLAELAAGLNRESMTTWVSRETLAERIGVSVKTVSNYLSQLKALGYIMAERRKTPQANNRVLLHYTLTALSPEEIETKITQTVRSLRGHQDSVVGFSRVPVLAGTRADSSRQGRKSFPVATGTADESSRQNGTESSRQDGRSNLANSNLVSNPPTPLEGGAPPLGSESSDEVVKGARKLAHDEAMNRAITEAVTAYNEVAKQRGFSIVSKLNSNRRDKLKARLRDDGGLDNWRVALAKVSMSSFCNGSNNRGWKADFDFLVQQTSYLRLLEGKYDDANAEATASTGPKKPRPFWWRGREQQIREMDIDVWRHLIRNHANGTWTEETLGPRPGTDECLVPKQLVNELDLVARYGPGSKPQH